MSVQVIILAAGLGSRLGRPHPKPLTTLDDGRSILARQIELLRAELDHPVFTIAVGFKKESIMEALPGVLFAYNESYDTTNTSKSLLKALSLTTPGGALWLNGDVVFDEALPARLARAIEADESFVCVNTAEVGEEEVKYRVDGEGYICELSKQVVGASGEAVGVNYVSSRDRADFVRQLHKCEDTDYFERGIELAVRDNGMRVRPLDVSDIPCIEVDFDDDLRRANRDIAKR